MKTGEIKDDDGQQIDYESFVNYKKDFNESRTLNFTSSEYFEEKRKERQHEFYDKAIYGVAALTTARLSYDTINSGTDLLKTINEARSSNILRERLQNAADKSALTESLFQDFADPSKRSLSNSLQSNLIALEELTPMHILKTLQLSSFTTLFVENIDTQNRQTIIGSDSIRVYEEYYRNLILNNSQYRIDDLDIENGFVLEKKKLYQRLGNGEKGKELLGYANIINTNLEVGDQNSPNRVFQKFANLQGVDTRLDQFKLEPLAVVGAKTKQKAQMDWMRSYNRFAMEIGYKVLDNPLGFIEEYSNALGAGESKIFQSEIFKKAKSLTNISLGTGGVYNESTRDSLKRVSKNLGTKSLVGYLGYQGINSILDDITPEDSIWHKGIAAGIAGTYASARVGFAQIWSDRFQGYKERQEEAAPESTKLTTLMGLPLAGAMGGANLAYFQRMYDTKKLGIEGASQKHSVEKKFEGYLGDALDSINMNKASTTVRRYSKLGAVMTGALSLPFLPGALIGASSEELAEEYSGKKEVAVRADRAWLMGGQAFEGGKIKYHRKSLIAETIANAKDKSLYENSDQKRAQDPIYSPFRYLKNPYAFEEAHTADMPYPVWGMDVTYGSFLGKAFQGTFGQIIKPDVINPLVEQLGKGKQGLIDTTLNAAGLGTEVETYTEEQLGEFRGGETREKAYVVPVNEDSKTKSLVQSGDMMAQPSPISSANIRSAVGGYTAMSDFIGMKGFAGNLTSRAMGIDPEEQLEPQLAVSGSARTAKKSIIDMQLGDAGGAGEFLRRLIPQSSATDMDVINPMANTVAPDWLPSNETKYFKNFKRGNYFSETTEHGETLLPSKGFAELTPELKDIDPNDYPLAYQYKILQNVAKGSAEHIATRNYLLDNMDTLSEKDKEVFFEAYEQEKDREQEKKFYEYKTSDEKARFGILQTAQNALWESFSHRESDFEPLTPFRPMAKFVHQRTAIEDYKRTQIAGSDAAIWTKPVEHFLAPTKNRLLQSLNAAYKPQDVEEKENVDEYFDKLALIKAAKAGDVYKSERTVAALASTGINDAKSMRQFKNALPDNQKPYVEAFSKETDARKRDEIAALLPDDISKGYRSIWKNIDAANYAKSKNIDVKKYLDSEYIKESGVIKKNKNIELESSVTEGIRVKAQDIISPEERDNYIKMAESKAIRMEAAQRDAEEYVTNQTGDLPEDDWVGWDPRLTIDDIKLKTLSVGKADLQRYGYWDKEIRRNDRIKILDKDDVVISEFDRIKRTLHSNNRRKHETKLSLRKQGFETSRIDYIPSAKQAVRITNKQEYLDNFEE